MFALSHLVRREEREDQRSLPIVPDDPVGVVLVPDHVPGVQKMRKRCPVSDSPIGTLAKQAQP